VPTVIASRAASLKPLVERRVAEAPLRRAVVQQQHLGAHRTVEPRDDCGPPALVVVGAHELEQIGGQRLDEHLDRATAREADLPRFLVTQIELEEPRAIRVEHVLGLLDHLRVNAAADGDGAEHGSAFADQHLRAFFARRGAARVDQGSRPRPCPETAEVRQFDRRVPPWALMIRRARSVSTLPTGPLCSNVQLAAQTRPGIV
jgi:hypothetical protein